MMSFKMALRSIGANKMRAALTMLGIIIGVMALVVLVSLVNGATGSVTDAVAELGSSMLTVSISDNKGKPADLDTVNEWMETSGIGQIAPYVSESATVSAEGESQSATLYGTTPAYYEIQGMQLSMGRFLKSADVENSTYVCVVSTGVAEEIIGYVDCVGQAIYLNGVEFTVVGVLSEDDNSLTAMVSSQSAAVYLPYTSLIRLSDSIRPSVTVPSTSFPTVGGNWSGGTGSLPQAEPEEETLFDTAVTEIAAVTPADLMSLSITVDELDVNRIKTGMTAEVKINALGGEKVSATVTEIGNTGSSEGGHSKFTVVMTLTRTENMLAGMNATAILVPDTETDAVTVSVKALVEKGTKTYVYTAYDEENESLAGPVEVTVGASDKDTVQILEGLREGDTYYYAYYDTLTISNTPDFGNAMPFGR